MTPSDREPTGQRIARARRRRGLSQAVLAGLVGRSESWLSQVERGKRGVDSHSVLVRLAEILRVDIEELTGSADRDETGSRAHPAAPLIEQAMMGYGAPSPVDGGEEPGREPSLDFLRAPARSAYQAYQATRYDAAGRILPGLIRGVETAARTEGSASPAACAVRARVYDTTAALLSRVGEPFLAWAAADRAMFAAEQSGDPLLAAASAWRLSYMITGRKHPQEALGLAMAAAAALDRTMRAPSPERLSVYGALHLAAATAAAASFDPATTGSLLATARGVADRTGEANHMGTAFGPVNVAIHAISASLRLGDPRTATEIGEALDLAAMPVGLVGRRTQVNLDLARAYVMTRKDAAAVNLLLAAERLSPQLVRYDPATRDVLTELLRREHRPSTPELRPSRAALASSDPHFCAGSEPATTFVRVPSPQRDPGFLSSRRCGPFQPLLSSLIAGQMRRTPGGTEVEERARRLRLVPDEYDQVLRLDRFRQNHPAVVVGAGNGWWQAVIPKPDGEIVTTRYTLRALLDKLDELINANPGHE